MSAVEIYAVHKLNNTFNETTEIISNFHTKARQDG